MKKITLCLFILTLMCSGVFSQSGTAKRAFPGPDWVSQIKAWPSDAVSSPVEFKGMIEQGFENYSDFTLDFSPWITNDVDGANTYSIEDHDFPNENEPMAFIVFNPANVSPSMAGDDAIQPHSGDKFAACFASEPPPYNDDWLITPMVNLGNNSALEFWVKSYTGDYGLEKYNVGVSTTNTNPSSFTIISGASPLLAPATAWEKVEFDLSAYDGQSVYIGIQCVSEDAFIFMVDDVKVEWEDDVTATLSGMVFDATNDEPIDGATVYVAGLSDVTDASGNYTITDVPAGVLVTNFTASPTTGQSPLTVYFNDLSNENAHTVTAEQTGYTPYENVNVNIPEGAMVTLDIPLSPEITAGQMRMVLSWSDFPEDLDAHLQTPEIEGEEWHVYWDDVGSANEAPYAQLDNDAIYGYGPETITIYETFTGTYKYYIFNYDEDTSITVSEAVVKIYNDAGLIYDLNVPAFGDGFYWYVCDIDGATQTVTLRNEILDAPPSRSIIPDKQKIKPPKPEMTRNITSWEWNFGDGNTSDLQNPDHIYTENGSYDVSLTVGTGSSQATGTKSNYIIVGEFGIDENLGSVPTIFPNPATENIRITSEETIRNIRITTLDGKQVFEQELDNTEYQFDVSGYEGGFYILWYQTETRTGSAKIVIGN